MRQISCMSVFNVLFFNLSFGISIFAVVQLLLIYSTLTCSTPNSYKKFFKNNDNKIFLNPTFKIY